MMRFTRVEAILLIVVLHIVVPLVLVVWSLIGPYGSLVDWATRVLLLVSYILFIFLVGSWVFAGFYARYLLCLLAAAAIALSAFSLQSLPVVQNAHWLFWVRNGLMTSAIVVLAILSVNALRAREFEQPGVSLSFPFENGTVAVFEGGNGRISPLMNYHYGSAAHGKSGVNNSMRYAVDITRLSSWGNDANGFFSRERERYPVFNAEGLCPCDGKVAAVGDQWPNEIPWSGKGPYNLGNCVLIEA